MEITYSTYLKFNSYNFDTHPTSELLKSFEGRRMLLYGSSFKQNSPNNYTVFLSLPESDTSSYLFHKKFPTVSLTSNSNLTPEDLKSGILVTINGYSQHNNTISCTRSTESDTLSTYLTQMDLISCFDNGSRQANQALTQQLFGTVPISVIGTASEIKEFNRVEESFLLTVVYPPCEPPDNKIRVFRPPVKNRCIRCKKCHCRRKTVLFSTFSETAPCFSRYDPAYS